MFKIIFRKIGRTLGLPSRVVRKYQDINPEDIFLDSTNLPGFEEYALEGRIERPISHKTFSFLKIFLGVLMLLLVGRLWSLSIKDGAIYAEISENNRLEQTIIFANRGAILDRNGVELAANKIKEESSSLGKKTQDFAGRQYAPISGLAHIVGYVKYPLMDNDGVYYEINYSAKDGVELAYDEVLKGSNGSKLVETDVMGAVTSESVVVQPEDGETVTLSIDSMLTQKLYNTIEEFAKRGGFIGGAAVLMDVETGEVLSLTSYPEYDQNELTRGISQENFSRLLRDPATPFLNRAVGGLYTPGSIVKPVVALAALKEGVISPEKSILSTGSITVPNPYDSDKPSIFKDWRAHGYTDMRKALAVSSDTYFYSIGGGYGDQKGLGITLLDKYFEQFGFRDKTGIELLGEVSGIIPTPEWKAEKFNGEPWRLGDTYITSIGQYGTQITPITAVRFIAAIANKGTFLKPSLLLGGVSDKVAKQVEFKEEDWRVVQEGMRAAVNSGGTSAGLNVPYVEVAAKTGTAEVGANKAYINSWSVGFFPYRNPRYAWALIMEKGPANNPIGATAVMRQVFDWMSVNAPEYFK